MIHYEVYVSVGMSDVVSRDTLEEARKVAKDWASKINENVAIVKVEETLVEEVTA